MSIREGNRLLVVNNLLSTVFSDDSRVDPSTLYAACRGFDFGDDKKKIHFRLRTNDRTVRLEIKNPERCLPILEQLVKQVADTYKIDDQEESHDRLVNDALPHVMAYVRHRHGLSTENIDVLILDTTVWLARQIDDKVDYAIVELLVSRMLAPPRKYATPRTMQEFEELERVYDSAKNRFKRPRLDDEC
jgi:hypothetical protein